MVEERFGAKINIEGIEQEERVCRIETLQTVESLRPGAIFA
jgi:hypothetical protein